MPFWPAKTIYSRVTSSHGVDSDSRRKLIFARYKKSQSVGLFFVCFLARIGTVSIDISLTQVFWEAICGIL